MKKLYNTSAFILFASLLLHAQLGVWSIKANFGGAGRSNAVGFSIGSYGYIGTGYTGVAVKDFWRYNPANNTWTQMADFGGSVRYNATGFVIGNYGYIGTGVNAGTYYKDFYKYDPSGNSWAPIANFGGNNRCSATAFAIGNNGYVGTGLDASVAYSDFWKYNSLTDTWTSRAAYSGGQRADCFAFAVSGKGYIGCGKNFAGSTFYNVFYQYDTTANSWTAKANFGGSVREGVGSFVIGNYGYAGIGSISNFGTRYIDFYKYNPVSDAWSAVASYLGPATGTTNAAGFSVNGLGYLGTGYNLAQTVNFFQYDACAITTTVTPTAPSCNGGSNGSINLTVGGATNPLTYLWSNSSTIQDPTGLSAGGYTVTITDGVGCTKTPSVTVTQPTALAGTITTVTNVSCFGICNGKITVAGSGATPPYTYLWSPSGGTTATASGLCAGNYSVALTDSKGCVASTNTVVTQPTTLTASVTGTNPATACSCDGSVLATASGGTPNYTYVWSPTNTTTGLCGGITYTVTATDSKGCTSTGTVSLFPAPVALTLTTTPATCPTCPDGNATANITGGTNPLTYLWNNGQTTQTATGLAPGTYPVCVFDADSCFACDSVYVGFAIGINEISNANISISPNPTSGHFSISGNGLQNSEIEIFNMVGEKIFLSEKNNHSNTLDISTNPDGMYFLKVRIGESVITKKLILNR